MFYFYLGISCCGVALRHVTEDFQLFSFTRGCFPYNGASYSAKHHEFVNKVLEEYKLVLDPTNFVITDNESRMLAAFREKYFRIGCAEHYFNKRLQHAFQSEKIYSNENTFETIDFELVQAVFGHIKK